MSELTLENFKRIGSFQEFNFNGAFRESLEDLLPAEIQAKVMRQIPTDQWVSRDDAEAFAEVIWHNFYSLQHSASGCGLEPPAPGMGINTRSSGLEISDADLTPRLNAIKTLLVRSD